MQNDAAQWLAVRTSDAPEQLRSRMFTALERASEGTSVYEHLALAASECLLRALADHANRDSALDLLAADALLTHACEAAAEVGNDTLTAFADAWNARRFDQLLASQTQ